MNGTVALEAALSDTRMTNKDLEKLIASGESDQLEFKSSFGKEAIETLCAFANTEGGQVLVGVSDTGQITGLNLSSETLQGWLNQIKQNTTPSLLPDILVSEVAAKKIVTITVQEFPVKPVAFRGKYFKRVENSNHQLTPAEISNLHLQSLSFSLQKRKKNSRFFMIMN